jgi:hypothetical protein
MVTQNLNQIANAVLTANVAAKQDRIVFGLSSGLRVPMAILSQGRLPSPSSHEHEPAERPLMYATAYVDADATRAGRLASFSGTLAGFGRLAGPISQGWSTWRCETTIATFGHRVRTKTVVGRASSDPVAFRRQQSSRDYLSHGCFGEKRDVDLRERNASLARGTAPTATRGK